ncbi:FliH/SctL family protein [Pararoseomonas sp. SCSIO 73927]|uniref:FliH/SctL family protein n=1 Tax=Pararoseomonas sp. SCSIO 73927 TaxID=3114537 RepID=UPI0030D06B01
MSAQRPLGRVIPASELGLLLEARAVLDAARAEAASVREAAHAEGLRTGRAEGAAAATRLLAETAAATRAALTRAEPMLAEALITALRNILGEAPSAERVAAAAAHALRGLSAQGEVVLRVAPGAVEAVSAALAGADGVTLRADPALGEADCVVETAFGHVEAGLPAQLRALRRGLGLPDEEPA